jgi:hypothetical protein
MGFFFLQTIERHEREPLDALLASSLP